MIGASVVLSLALLAGRLTGLLRELELAALFGISPTADMAVLLLTLPDLLVNLLISGGLSAVLVPRFTRLQGAQAMALFRQASLAVVMLFGAAGLLLVLWPQSLFQLLAPGVPPSMLPSPDALIGVAIALPLSGAAGVAGAYLNAGQRFLVVGSGTLFFNIGVLVALVLARNSTTPLTMLAVGIVAGAALRWAAQLALLPGQVWFAKATGKLVDAGLAKAFMAATVSSALVLFAPIIVRAMASMLGPGVIASFNYAQKLVELPVTILITSISTVALSRLSALFAQNKGADAVAATIRDTQYALMVAIAVAVFGIAFADSVVHVIFARGKMDEFALQRITDLVKIAMLGVPALAISSMATAYLNGSNQVPVVLKVTFGSLLFLPLFALPGLMLKSEQILMLAVVGVQAVTAVWLALAAKLRLFGTGAIFSWQAAPYFGTAAALAMLCIGLDAMFELTPHFVRLSLASAGFAIVLALPIRRFLRFTSYPAVTK
jgi:putative peptidoglycan lipid II flippase